jgi:DNA-binding transcriptional LysR family regulator
MHETAINQQINLKFRVQVNSFDAICRMVAIGLGIGVLPLNSISYGMIGEQLHIVKINNAWANRKLFLGMNKQVKQTPEALNLFQFLQQQNNRDFPYKT